MLNIDASIHLIRSYANRQGLSAEKYGKAARIPASTARDVLKGRGNPTYVTLRAMEAVVPPELRKGLLPSSVVQVMPNASSAWSTDDVLFNAADGCGP